MTKSGESLTVKSEKKNPSDRNNYSLEGKKKGQRDFFVYFYKIWRTQSHPAVSTRSNQLQIGVTRCLPTLKIKVRRTVMACLLSFPLLQFQGGNFIYALMPPVRSISILIHLWISASSLNQNTEARDPFTSCSALRAPSEPTPEAVWEWPFRLRVHTCV